MAFFSEKFGGNELTLRGLVLGIALTLIFTAANIFLGLKVGLTFATSIPAAVISMAALRAFRGSNIRENNIVQTVASAAGAMASIIFVLPGLVIVGWWTGFPYWMSFLVCAAGGVLGVLFTIPLRRALVTHSDLPYPEGRAAAEVLRVGSGARGGQPEARAGIWSMLYGSLASAGFAIATAMRLTIDSVGGFFRLGATSASGYTFSYSFALMGAGHLVGISVGISMLIGLVVTWGIAVPYLTGITPQDGAALSDFVTSVWRSQVRYIGAGAMGIAALWSLLRTVGPVLGGLSDVVRAGNILSDDHSDRDMRLRSIGVLTLVCTLASAALVWFFLHGTVLDDQAILVAVIAVPIILIGGFLIAAICGYMAGLIGSSNSPVSGVGILAVVGCATMLVGLIAVTPQSNSAMVAVALFITAIVFAGAVSSNDNLQDLKTGQLVGAAPWRQQVALIIGVIAAASVIPFVLNLLAQAYGFAGAPNLHVITARPLPAPQANLISTLAEGVIGNHLNWTMIGIGACVGAAVILLDEFMGWRKWIRIPPLAAGFGIYLPMSATIPVVVGAFLGWLYDCKVKTEGAKRLGVLMASGLIVGESLFGVINAGLIVAAGRESPLAVVAEYAAVPTVSLLAFSGLTITLYIWLLRKKDAT